MIVGGDSGLLCGEKFRKRVLGNAHIAAVPVNLHVILQLFQKGFLLLYIIIGRQDGIVDFPAPLLNFTDKGKHLFLHSGKKAVVHFGACSHLIAVKQIVVIRTAFIQKVKNLLLALYHLFQIWRKHGKIIFCLCLLPDTLAVRQNLLSSDIHFLGKLSYVLNQAEVKRQLLFQFAFLPCILVHILQTL